MSFLLTLLKQLKQPRKLVITLLGILLVLLFAFGAKLGVNLFWRLIVGGALLVLGLGLAWLVGRIEKRRQADRIEQSLVLEAAAGGPDDKSRKRLAREEMAAAIARLKASRLADGRSGRDALSILPWYLVIGAPESGRSAMIAHSGLPFPAGAADDPAAARTIGSNCCWWFSNQAVLLEVDGRFAVDPGSATDGDWEIFLNMLRKQQRDPALNGLVVTVAADDLVSRDETWLRERAGLLRRRLDRIAGGLDLLCPVYLVVTRSDLINGFQEFFGDLQGSARDQVWGATFSAKLMTNPMPGDLFAQEFDLLLRALDRRRLPRLIRTEQDQPTQQQAYLFPLELYKLRDKLRAFGETLFAPSAYAHQPLWRGFYFAAAGGGAERPAETVLADMSQVIGLPGYAGYTPPPPVPAGAREPRFLRTLFLNVLIPDQNLARPTARALRRRYSWRLIARTAAVLLLPALLAVGTISLVRNLQLVRDSRTLADGAQGLKPDTLEPQAVARALHALEPLHSRLVQLEAWQTRRPLTLDMGLYRGERIGRALRRVYFDRLREVLLLPSHVRLQARLVREIPRDQESFDRYFRGYQVYRMLTKPEDGDPELIAGELRALWFGQTEVPDGTVRQLQRLGEHVAYAWRHPLDLREAAQHLPLPDEALNRTARGYILKFWDSGLVYRGLIKDVNAAGPSFSRDSKPAYRNLLAQTSDGRADSLLVPHAFTNEGWQLVLAGIAESEQRLKSNWLLQETFAEEKLDIRSDLLKEYLRDHRTHWVSFLGSVQLAPPASVNEAYRRLDEWAPRTSVLFRFLEDAHGALSLRGDLRGLDPADVQAIQTAAAEYHAVQQFFQVQGSGDQAREPAAAYAEQLGKLVTFLYQLEQEDDTLAAAVAQAREIFKRQGRGSSPLEGAWKEIPRLIVPGGDKRCDLALEAFLRRPVSLVWQACLRATERHLDEQWERAVWSVYRDQLSGFPLLRQASNDIVLQDFADFFRGDGTLDSFVKTQLDGFVSADWRPQSALDGALGLRTEATRAFADGDRMRRVLFHGGAAEPEVDFRLTPRQTVNVRGSGPNPRFSRLVLGQEEITHDITGRQVEKMFQGPVERFGRQASVSLLPEQDFAAHRLVVRGDWALFRLFGQARQDALGNDRFRLVWVTSDRAREIEIPFDLTVDPRRNPFRSGFFAFECPRRLF